jgi:ABC-type antimicrobial peptide transport system permease subunit
VRFAEKPKYPSYTVVGVVGSVAGETIPGGASRMLYFPVLDDLRADPNADVPIPFVPREMTIVVQTSLPPTPLVPAVRRILRDLDPKIPISRVRTMEQIVAASTAHTSLAMVLLLTAACIALFLGSLGVYGVVSYVVTRRTREIGIRMALGAHAADVSRMVLRQGAGVVLIGIAIGSLAALVLTRFLRSLLFEVSPSNPITFIVMSLLLLTVALLASYLPTRRAARVDPMIALRSE